MAAAPAAAPTAAASSGRPAADLDVEIRGARLSFAGRPLFVDLNVRLPAGRWTCLLGPSGVGKSSLLRLIAGLEAPERGGVRAGDGRPLAGRVAWLDQRDSLLPWLTVLDNVTLGARLRGEPRDERRARALLAAVGLEDRARERPGGLSGGQRQRVALARTLMEDRPVVLMDEPFSALDAITRARLQALAARLLAGRTVLLVTHDPLEALRLGHAVHVMAGRPAILDQALVLPDDPPRAVDDPEVLVRQGELLARLARAEEAGGT
ncbi:MAG TPA: ABC transporter ATP-binding protein [Geminicoccaceae bacterium]|nr:ABC transporter ATP-binding protein [Geminicoccaceae bacterium]